MPYASLTYSIPERSILRQLGAITPEELERLAEYGPQFPIYNFRKIHVGDARPSFTLHRSG